MALSFKTRFVRVFLRPLSKSVFELGEHLPLKGPLVALERTTVAVGCFMDTEQPQC